jgi:hypothetical protein
MSLSNIIKVMKQIEFGTLYIKPAFVYADDNNNIYLQFEADSSSALGYLYSALCQQLGISWNYNSPSNKYGLYTNCAMHSSGDRANYGCGPDNSNSGGFCPRMAMAYRAKFNSQDYAAAYLTAANNYVNYWRKLYPTGVAVGTSSFCKVGGCLGLFLNRMDLYQVFSPDLGTSWVEYNGGTIAPTISPAPTSAGGCDNPANAHLDRCFRVHNKRASKAHGWKNLGPIGQACVVLVTLMASTLALSIFLARARRRKRKGESYLGFFLRDLSRSSKKSKKLKKRRKDRDSELAEDMLEDDKSGHRSSRSKNKSRSRSKSRARSRAAGESSSSRRDSDPSVSRSGSRSRSASRSRRSSSRARGSSERNRASRSRSESRARRQLV